MSVNVTAALDVFAASGMEDDTYAQVAADLRLAAVRLAAADRLCTAVLRSQGMQPGPVVTAAAEYIALSNIDPAAA